MADRILKHLKNILYKLDFVEVDPTVVDTLTLASGALSCGAVVAKAVPPLYPYCVTIGGVVAIGIVIGGTIFYFWKKSQSTKVELQVKLNNPRVIEEFGCNMEESVEILMRSTEGQMALANLFLLIREKFISALHDGKLFQPVADIASGYGRLLH
eukprot:TRINITY_DN9846_c0_g1_i1.p1 TRINITY_DN9846_c0_g1~~TRINITY_DN9846_c0_g1_i1.p1  ORF type:complete len:155 (-),score=25.34 TRINITY_DN9846_c0_g1_i1:24-488(-)